MATSGTHSYSYVTLVAAGSAMGGLLFGFDTSTMNSAINGIRETMTLSAGQVGFVTAIALIGCAVGAWFAGPVSSRIGRTRVMLIAGIGIVLGSIGAALSGVLWLLTIFRLVSGVGIGAASAVVRRATSPRFRRRASAGVLARCGSSPS